MRDEADGQAREIKAQARLEAREITSDAHVMAREVLDEGTEVSRNLRELSVSLRNNAERLLRDITLAHGGMTARLDQVGGDGRGEPSGPPSALAPRAGFPRAKARTSTCPSSSRAAERPGQPRSGSARGATGTPVVARIHLPGL